MLRLARERDVPLELGCAGRVVDERGSVADSDNARVTSFSNVLTHVRLINLTIKAIRQRAHGWYW